MKLSGTHADPKIPTLIVRHPVRLCPAATFRERCTNAVERMKRETEATLKRMQTDIDNLRSKLRN